MEVPSGKITEMQTENSSETAEPDCSIMSFMPDLEDAFVKHCHPLVEAVAEAMPSVRAKSEAFCAWEHDVKFSAAIADEHYTDLTLLIFMDGDHDLVERRQKMWPVMEQLWEKGYRPALKVCLISEAEVDGGCGSVLADRFPVHIPCTVDV